MSKKIKSIPTWKIKEILDNGLFMSATGKDYGNYADELIDELNRRYCAPDCQEIELESKPIVRIVLGCIVVLWKCVFDNNMYCFEIIRQLDRVHFEYNPTETPLNDADLIIKGF